MQINDETVEKLAGKIVNAIFTNLEKRGYSTIIAEDEEKDNEISLEWEEIVLDIIWEHLVEIGQMRQMGHMKDEMNDLPEGPV